MTKMFCDVCEKELNRSDNFVEFTGIDHDGNSTALSNIKFTVQMCEDCWNKFQEYSHIKSE